MRGIEIKDDGRAMVFGQFLKEVVAIHEHYKARGERLVGVVGDRLGQGGIYEATVARNPRLFEAKLTVDEHGVCEFAREEI